MDELAKIDLIRTRFNISYKEAKAALDAAAGDVLQALINLEDEGEAAHTSTTDTGFFDKGSELFEQFKGMINNGITDKKQGYKIKLKHKERTVAEIPAPLGALGLLGALVSSQIAIAGVLASVAGMANNYSLEIQRPKGPEEPKDDAQCKP